MGRHNAPEVVDGKFVPREPVPSSQGGTFDRLVIEGIERKVSSGPATVEAGRMSSTVLGAEQAELLVANMTTRRLCSQLWVACGMSPDHFDREVERFGIEDVWYWLITSKVRDKE